jgi:hypothetical protein
MDELAKSYETRTKEFFELREEHEALRARLVQVEGNLSVAEDALLRHGYRKSCSIAACNCGDQWSHGGSARERLTEIGEAFDSAGIDRNGKTLLQATNETIARAEKAEQENARLREALRFYADKNHFAISDEDVWDTVSGEPGNFWCDEAGTATVEDGWVARTALSGESTAATETALWSRDIHEQ